MFNALTSLIDAVTAIDQPARAQHDEPRLLPANTKCSPGIRAHFSIPQASAGTDGRVCQATSRSSAAVSLPSLRAMNPAASLSVHRSRSDHSLQAQYKQPRGVSIEDEHAERLPGVSALLSIGTEGNGDMRAAGPPVHAPMTSASPSTKGMQNMQLCVSRVPEPSSMSLAPSAPSSGNASASGGYTFITRIHDPCAAGAKPKIPRKRISSEQTNTLQTLFDGGLHFPSREMRDRLARQLGLNSRTIQVWFQNRRQAARNKMRGGERPPCGQRLAIRWMKPVVFADAAHSSCTGHCIHATAIAAAHHTGSDESVKALPPLLAKRLSSASGQACLGGTLPAYGSESSVHMDDSAAESNANISELSSDLIFDA